MAFLKHVFLAAAFSCAVFASCPKKIIIDTDLLNFDDDPLAIGLANIFQIWGEAEILGIVSSVSSQYAPPAIDAINTFFGHEDIPIAIQKPLTNITQDPNYSTPGGDYVTGLTFGFPEDIRNGANTTDPFILYRTLLSEADNDTITIVVIGDMDNMFHLIQSPADNISSLTGHELIASKVHEMVVQANAYGQSFNLYNHNTTFAEVVLNSWPMEVKLTLVGDNIGSNTITGSRLTTELDISTNPLAYAFNISSGYDTPHSIWDVTAMYYAVRGLEDVYANNFTHGQVKADADANTYWDFASNLSNQNALIFAEDGIGNVSFATRLEDLLLWSPGKVFPSNLRNQTTCVSMSNATLLQPTGTGTLTPFTGGGSKIFVSSSAFVVGSVFVLFEMIL